MWKNGFIIFQANPENNVHSGTVSKLDILIQLTKRNEISPKFARGHRHTCELSRNRLSRLGSSPVFTGETCRYSAAARRLTRG